MIIHNSRHYFVYIKKKQNKIRMKALKVKVKGEIEIER